MKLEELADTVTGTHDIFLQGDQGTTHLAVLSALFVGNVAAILEVVVLENLGETSGIPLVGLDSVHLRFRYDVGWDDHAVYAIFGKRIIEVKTLEPCFVDEVNQTFRELVPEIADQHSILRFHRCLVDDHFLRPHRKLPGPLRILDSHKNFLASYDVILYPIILLHSYPPFDLVADTATTDSSEKKTYFFLPAVQPTFIA